MASKTAILVQPNLEHFNGEARLYRLSEPIGWGYDYDTGQYEKTTEYVIVSAVVAFGDGPETYIFPADAEGIVLDWSELDGSYRGDLNHERALTNIGYVVVDVSDAQEVVEAILKGV